MNDYCQNVFDNLLIQKDSSNYRYSREMYSKSTISEYIYKRIESHLTSENLLIFFLGCVVIYIIVYIFNVISQAYFSPNIYVKELTEVGFEHIAKGEDRKLRIARAQAARRMGNKIPPPYPNGWFAIGESEDLKTCKVLAVDALGQNLCLYRGRNGKAYCVDAYCPHLGANLAVGGTVTENCIECPFHKWSFDETGTCVRVPGVENAPKGVSLKHWLTVEVDGAIWIWHDAEGRDPLWEVPELPELEVWDSRGRNEFTVSAHIQEIPENGADVAHLNSVHSLSVLELFGHHVWSANWEPGEDHTASMDLTHDYILFGRKVGHIDVKITQIGPGHVRLLLKSPVGPILVSQSVTPLGPLQQKVVHRMFSPTKNAIFAMLLVNYEAKQFARDVAIWNNKRFVSAPAYVKTDKAIRAFRNWFSQFYSEKSISFKDAHQNNLDW
ncbi:cholesterol 7-desaturase [Trichoplusia ni]|uniref:cholesterol 7-desaturase n=1 Tax=Trichoplusia ni TaxID=7111 RepID=A0A7E5X5Y6_TRINI|nr:cholesterol 7-desaturase [Trichoplusia ni]XP_026748071.1 cholesterol 7-desaturase [Trichoplusia ni]